MARLLRLTTDDEIAEALEELLEDHERGELGCIALRVHNVDGTVEEIVLNASSQEEHEQALAELRASFRKTLN